MNNEAIQSLKEELLQENRIKTEAGARGSNSSMAKWYIEQGINGFAANICQTVARSGWLSEKQAYCIARGVVEQGLMA